MFHLGNKALIQSETINNPTLKLGALATIAFSRWRGSSIDELKKHVEIGFKWFQEFKSTLTSNLAKFYFAFLKHAEFLIYFETGDIAKAEELTHEITQLRREINDEYGLARTFLNLAATKSFEGNWADTQKYTELAIVILRKIKNLDSLAHAVGIYAEYKHQKGELEQSAELWEEALQLHRKVGNTERIGSDVTMQILFALEVGDKEKANQQLIF